VTMDDFTPPTQPSGSLVPPPTNQPTAVAVATPEPPRPPRELKPYMRDQAMRRWLQRALDAVDSVADAVAKELRIR